VKTPIAALASQTGEAIFTVNSSGDFVAFSPNGARVGSASCNCSPARLEPLRGLDVFLVSTSSGELVTVEADNAALPRLARFRDLSAQPELAGERGVK
jgi:hypothetical protein